MVAPTWDLMSSPMIGTPASSNFLAHSGSEAMKTGQGVDEGHAGVDGALGVELVGLLGAHRQVGDEHVGAGLLEDLDDVDRVGAGLLDGHPVVLAETVERRAALHLDAQGGDVADLDGVVLRGVDGLGEVLADLHVVDVERRDELDVADVVVTERDVHQTGHGAGGVGVLVVLDTLDQGGRAVADSHDCYSNRTHRDSFPGHNFWSAAGVAGGLLVVGAVGAWGICLLVWHTIALGVDQLREPLDLAFDRLDTVALELGRVAVDLLLRHRQLGLDPVETLLEAGATALEHAQPDLHVGGREEGETDVEVVVLPRGRTHLRHQPLELASACLGDLIGDARPLRHRGARGLGGQGLLDEGGPQHLLQGRVERPVGQHPTPSEHEVQALAELVAVHGCLVQQSEDCELDSLCTTCHATYRSDISARCEHETCLILQSAVRRDVSEGTRASSWAAADDPRTLTRIVTPDQRSRRL